LKTGTGAVEAAESTAALAGAYTPPTKTGTVEVAAKRATVALTGTSAGPIITGTVAVAGARTAVSIYGDLIALPPPSSSGVRIGTWFRPA